MNDSDYMNLAILQACRATIDVAPNPYVGAVLVKDSKIIGSGFHRKYGEHHAEVDAINNASSDVQGATLYVTLEPCCHINKQTPPCTDLIIKHKIAKVVIGSTDPNPEVSGRGLQILKEAGIEVLSGILKTECDSINKAFFKFIKTGLPYVHLKFAQTLDGKIATNTKDSKWISGEESRLLVHEQRAMYQSILVGAGTARADNPKLTSRLETTYCPTRFVVSNSKKLDKGLHIFTDEFKDKTQLISSEQDSFKSILEKIAEKKISSVYIEGGHSILCQVLKEDLWDEISIFVALKIIGSGIGATDGIEITKMDDAIKFNNADVSKIGEDIHVHIRR
jgi:diaminohydroxyphosphoribosylaminopyrimidine deaminase/5-amino-6-(5-phosphoribosylamino)uracil reductase